VAERRRHLVFIMMAVVAIVALVSWLVSSLGRYQSPPHCGCGAFEYSRNRSAGNCGKGAGPSHAKARRRKPEGGAKNRRNGANGTEARVN